MYEGVSNTSRNFFKDSCPNLLSRYLVFILQQWNTYSHVNVTEITSNLEWPELDIFDPYIFKITL